MTLPDGAQLLIDIIEADGSEAFAVGGCVRDYLMQRPCDDVDITTSATPDVVEKILQKNHIRFIETGLKHGTITAVLNNETYEITTYRTDGKYNDNRHPDEVEFVSSIDKDLARRDFTVNAMAYNDSKGIVDLYGGRSDIKDRLIRTVGDADTRFREDALRIMRALRFASVLSFDIEPKTGDAILANKDLLENVSAERLFTELSKLLLGDNVYNILSEYREVIAVVIPELREIFDVPQNTKWHIYDVWHHTCKAVESAPRDVALRLTMLMHDIGKARCRVTDPNGVDHFFGHQRVSAEMTEPVLRRLKVSNEIYDRVMALVPIHDAHISTDKRRIKKWLSKTGEDILFDLVEVKKSDKLAQNPQLTDRELDNLDITKQLIQTIIDEGEPFLVKDMNINGNDLISLGLQGRQIGEALDYLLEMVISGEIENKKEILVEKIKNDYLG